MEETPLETSSQFAAPAPKRKINKRFIYLIAVIVILLLLFMVYKLGFSKKSDINQNIPLTPAPTEVQIPTDTQAPEATQTPIPTDTPTPTPTPKPTGNPIDSSTGLDRSKLSVTVENGSGAAGVAGTGKDFLNGLGYDISSTSNADNFDYTGVTIQVKSSASDYLDLLKSDLGAKYTVSSATSDLSDSNSSDAVVIIGK